MRNDLTKTMDMTIWPETYQKAVFSRRYIIGVAQGLLSIEVDSKIGCHGILIKNERNKRKYNET